MFYYDFYILKYFGRQKVKLAEDFCVGVKPTPSVILWSHGYIFGMKKNARFGLFFDRLVPPEIFLVAACNLV